MGYIKIGLSLVFLIIGISTFIIRAIEKLNIISAGEYFLAIKLFFFDAVFSELIITVAFMLYKDSKKLQLFQKMNLLNLVV